MSFSPNALPPMAPVSPGCCSVTIDLRLNLPCMGRHGRGNRSRRALRCVSHTPHTLHTHQTHRFQDVKSSVMAKERLKQGNNMTWRDLFDRIEMKCEIWFFFFAACRSTCKSSSTTKFKAHFKVYSEMSLSWTPVTSCECTQAPPFAASAPPSVALTCLWRTRLHFVFWGKKHTVWPWLHQHLEGHCATRSRQWTCHLKFDLYQVFIHFL